MRMPRRNGWLISRRRQRRFSKLVPVRPVWCVATGLNGISGQVAKLHAREKQALGDMGVFLRLVEKMVDAELTDSVLPLNKTATNDLVAGCELARVGYLKQAFSLWRAWFEQVIFALFFIESPIYHMAWAVTQTVGLEDNPKFRLILHQIVSEGSEKHPFAIVYSERFVQLLSRLKVSNLSKDRYVVKRPGRVLTALSQGVHGTYRPKDIDGEAKIDERLEKDVIPIFDEMAKVVGQLWCLYLMYQMDMSDDMLLQLRTGALTGAHPDFAEVPAADIVDGLNMVFSRHFGVIN